MNIERYWSDTLRQNAEAMRAYFDDNAYIKWHNTNELFNSEEFIRANCEYLSLIHISCVRKKRTDCRFQDHSPAFPPFHDN